MSRFTKIYNPKNLPRKLIGQQRDGSFWFIAIPFTARKPWPCNMTKERIKSSSILSDDIGLAVYRGCGLDC